MANISLRKKFADCVRIALGAPPELPKPTRDDDNASWTLKADERKDLKAIPMSAELRQALTNWLRDKDDSAKVRPGRPGAPAASGGD